MPKYRKKPVVIEAIQFVNTVECLEELTKFMGVNDYAFDTSCGDMYNLIIHTLEGDHVASIGDYIIKGVNGEFYPCKPFIFEKTYDLVEE